LNWGVSLATPLVRMASPRPPRRRQGVGGTPHERKADTCAGKKCAIPLRAQGKRQEIARLYSRVRAAASLQCRKGEREEEREKRGDGERTRQRPGIRRRAPAPPVRRFSSSTSPRPLLRPSAGWTTGYRLCSAHPPAGPRPAASAPPVRRPSAHLRLKPEPTCAQPVVLSAD
jgi:hypothetical protein